MSDLVKLCVETKTKTGYCGFPLKVFFFDFQHGGGGGVGRWSGEVEWGGMVRVYGGRVLTSPIEKLVLKNSENQKINTNTKT